MRVLFLGVDESEHLIIKNESCGPCFPIDNTFSKFNESFTSISNLYIGQKLFYITIKPEIRDYNIGDPAYFIDRDVLFYGIIKHMSIYYVKFENGTWTGKGNLVPYKWWLLKKNCKLAILEFCKCSKRLQICRDVRNIISKLIWDSRNDYIWL
jgi:hypothetical protein